MWCNWAKGRNSYTYSSFILGRKRRREVGENWGRERREKGWRGGEERGKQTGREEDRGKVRTKAGGNREIDGNLDISIWLVTVVI